MKEPGYLGFSLTISVRPKRHFQFRQKQKFGRNFLPKPNILPKITEPAGFCRISSFRPKIAFSAEYSAKFVAKYAVKIGIICYFSQILPKCSAKTAIFCRNELIRPKIPDSAEYQGSAGQAKSFLPKQKGFSAEIFGRNTTEMTNQEL